MKATLSISLEFELASFVQAQAAKTNSSVSGYISGLLVDKMRVIHAATEAVKVIVPPVKVKK